MGQLTSKPDLTSRLFYLSLLKFALLGQYCAGLDEPDGMGRAVSCIAITKMSTCE